MGLVLFYSPCSRKTFSWEVFAKTFQAHSPYILSVLHSHRLGIFASDGLGDSFSYLSRMFTPTRVRGFEIYHLVRNIPFILLLALGSTSIPRQAYKILTEKKEGRRFAFSLCSSARQKRSNFSNAYNNRKRKNSTLIFGINPRHSVKRRKKRFF